ncbi:MAG TPA: hypothetical protein VJN29_17270 [Intrasporangium sp.]|uniref:esterase/lipase family protein n=1 Tax=Intrasporangium sp. TaxID=1925024 RepID=UPI002B4641FF|nr:hypothetical protein [Intrasporangium sp.]HKX68968.1 hypothetical protein [Intrasporangium sp.]
MAQLDGSTRRVDLGRGVVITAPGLRGSAVVQEGPLGGRSGEPERTTEAWDDALARAGLRQAVAVEIEATAAPGAGGGAGRAGEIRTAEGEPGLVLDVPDLGPTRGQVLLLVDEAGVPSWHYPEARTRPGSQEGQGGSPGDTSRGGGATVRFVVPSAVGAPRVAEGEDAPVGDRSLITMIGKKILSVLVYAIVEELVGATAQLIASKWEESHRPTRLRDFGPAAFGSAVVSDGFDATRLTTGRSLLFVHGTFSTGHGSFGALPSATMETLAARYQGRVFALDHPTLSVDPDRNARDFLGVLRDLGPDSSVELDLVCHSRGGLVGRALAGAADLSQGRLTIGRTIFVASPNAGTPLADGRHLGAFVNRVTALLNLAPPGPWTVVLDVLDAVLEVVKIIGQGALGGLPGLSSMRPGGEFLARIASAAPDGSRLYAIDADFEPTGSLAALWRLPESVLDKIFGDQANDGVVPSEGVGFVAGALGFRVGDERSLHLTSESGTWHCSFFTQPRVSEALTAWLPG